jgi:hypothetical protein
MYTSISQSLLVLDMQFGCCNHFGFVLIDTVFEVMLHQENTLLCTERHVV